MEYPVCNFIQTSKCVAPLIQDTRLHNTTIIYGSLEAIQSRPGLPGLYNLGGCLNISSEKLTSIGNSVSITIIVRIKRLGKHLACLNVQWFFSRNLCSYIRRGKTFRGQPLYIISSQSRCISQQHLSKRYRRNTFRFMKIYNINYI